METTDAFYLANIEALAISVLNGVRKLREIESRESDAAFADLRKLLIQTDMAAWGTVDWVSGGRRGI